MKILLVEDEELYADQVEILIDKMGYELLGVHDTSEKALSAISEQVPDLILMDIHIRGEYDGIELADFILQKYRIPIIFVSSLKDDLTFKRASRVGATNFILKPFDQIQLQRSIELACANTKQNADKPSDDSLISDHFFARRKDQYERVDIADIDYIEADGQYCLLYANDKKYVLNISMTNVINKLATNTFIKTHRSFIINRTKITSVNPKESTINIRNHIIPISRRNKSIIISSLGSLLE